MTAGTTYFYGVESADSGGDLSPMSALVEVTIPSPPAAVTNLMATPPRFPGMKVTLKPQPSLLSQREARAGKLPNPRGGRT
ncbi:MAG TPA: hypothetical protein VMR62_29635 [Bryobacteraceae bacterium]|nr:hypothetical protein [Bryobacteraceae bacterium]